jgi:5-methylcytosine-specific restriction endonuclease McrA
MPQRVPNHRPHQLPEPKVGGPRRPSASQLGYGREWRKLREIVLRRQPICIVPGCGHSATDIDHIVPRRRGGQDVLGNLQALCHFHHSQKTAATDGGFGNRMKNGHRRRRRGTGINVHDERSV